ncbi:tannase/feruloyl esterase family alpha/beta hydrolase [Caulobacter sp. CCNWLY153]|uniref:tannase/feruloyl esterase family alpha/beta hydrolase n=1 Tax=unclassified Caulobacter TaxID=2648921 RepID=UPI002FEEAF9C
MRLKPSTPYRAKPGALALGGAATIAGLVLAAQTIAPAAASKDASDKAAPAERCAALKGRTLGGAVVESGERVAKGDTLLKTPFGEAKARADYCKIKAKTSSGPGSTIKLEVYLPNDWNGKLWGVGGGGLSGGLATAGLTLGSALEQGYAGVATDAGHDDAPDAAWAINAPIRIRDFGFNANHLGVQAAKAAIETYYGQPAKKAYFHGCSNGGRDALMLAQRFPQDYDGIVVGAPAANYTGVMASFARNQNLFTSTPGAQSLLAKLPLLHDAVMQRCDKLDGVADGVLEDPSACKFDPAQLQCKPGQDPGKCLTAPEVGFARAVYQGTRGRDGKLIYPGLPVSSEYNASSVGPLGWGPWFMSPPYTGSNLAKEFYRGLVKQDVKWELASFNLDRDNAEAKAKVGADLDALDPDLRPFLKRGGKLLIYHGWEDAAIPAQATLDYYAAMRKRTGRAADDNVRLFMAPGMNHCGQGPGPNTLDQIGDIDRWISSGKAPQQIIAVKPSNGLAAFFGAKVQVARSRPLCAYPMVSTYKGSGSTDEAANFSCKLPRGVKG